MSLVFSLRFCYTHITTRDKPRKHKTPYETFKSFTMNGSLYKHITKRLHSRYDPLSQDPESSSPERTEEHSLFIKQNAKTCFDHIYSAIRYTNYKPLTYGYFEHKTL